MSAGLVLFECRKLHARISRAQCERNRMASDHSPRGGHEQPIQCPACRDWEMFGMPENPGTSVENILEAPMKAPNDKETEGRKATKRIGTCKACGQEKWLIAPKEGLCMKCMHEKHPERFEFACTKCGATIKRHGLCRACKTAPAEEPVAEAPETPEAPEQAPASVPAPCAVIALAFEPDIIEALSRAAHDSYRTVGHEAAWRLRESLGLPRPGAQA